MIGVHDLVIVQQRWATDIPDMSHVACSNRKPDRLLPGLRTEIGRTNDEFTSKRLFPLSIEDEI